jgi:hypothetical protein
VDNKRIKNWRSDFTKPTLFCTDGWYKQYGYQVADETAWRRAYLYGDDMR